MLQAIPDVDLRELVLCAVSTGMRRGELLALKWSDIDFSRRFIVIRNSNEFRTKSGKVRVIPMTDALWRILQNRRERAPNERDLVFQWNGLRMDPEAVTKRFKRAVKVAGLSEDLHFHSLRHTFASWLAQDGISLYAIQKLLGHSSSVVTQIYAHLAASELHGVVNMISIDLTPTAMLMRPDPTP